MDFGCHLDVTQANFISPKCKAALIMAAFGYIFCLSLLMAVIAAFFDQVLAYRRDDARDYLFCAFLSVLGFVVTSYFIPIVKEIMLRNNMWGFDINKNGKELNIRVYVQNRSKAGSTR